MEPMSRLHECIPIYASVQSYPALRHQASNPNHLDVHGIDGAADKKLNRHLRNRKKIAAYAYAGLFKIWGVGGFGSAQLFVRWIIRIGIKDRSRCYFV